MSTLYGCPICSVLRPDANLQGALGWVKSPLLVNGARTKKFFFSRGAGCSHAPNVPAVSDTNEAEAAWNEWARAEADVRTKALGYSPARRILFLYMIGIASVHEVLVIPEDPRPPVVPFKPMVDLEDRKRLLPVGNAVPAVDAMQGVARQIKDPLS